MSERHFLLHPDGYVAFRFRNGDGGPVLAVRDARTVAPLISAVLAQRPGTVIVEMGVPGWVPPSGTAYLATYGASRVCAQAAAEALGLASVW